MRNKKGFTMVELLVVLIIVAILAAVATPIYMANTRRAKASEAVAAMGLIRQALRDYQLSHTFYFDINGGTATVVAAGTIQNGLPTRLVVAADNSTTGQPVPGTAGVQVDQGVAKYFSNGAYSVDAAGTAADGTRQDMGTGTSTLFTTPHAVDFIIRANGANSEACVGDADTNCATTNIEVANYRLEMDNSGRTFVSYDAGATWSAY